MSTILEKGIKQTIQTFDDKCIESLSSRMERYINELILFNSAYNLTNTSDHDELVIRHILDSLSGFELIKSFIDEHLSTQSKVVIGDIGSGGGLPGIPLAAAFLCGTGDGESAVSFKLVERMEKRCSFLENCCGLLGLTNTEVCNLQAEKVESELFDVITFRAFRPLDEKMTKTLLRMVKPGGVLFAYKARMENIKTEMEGIKKLVSDYDVSPLIVPGLEDSERNMVVIRK